MARSVLCAAIDIGTTKVCTLVGQAGASGELEVTGVGITPSRGLHKGMVVDIDEAVEAIRASVLRAERTSGDRIFSASIGITGSHLSFLENRGTVTMAGSHRLVSEGDVSRVLESARTTAGVPSNKEILHVLPKRYLLDGQEGIRNPVGLHGFRLDVDAHIVMGAITSIQNLTTCVEQAGVEVETLVLEPLASGEAVLTEDERETGVLLVDIGGGTTDLAVFSGGSIGHTAVIPIGGHQFTHDLVIGLRTPLAAAEGAKVASGLVDPTSLSPDDTLEISAFGDGSRRAVSKRLMSEILRARLDELLELIDAEVRQSGYKGVLPAGVVLTGGSANLVGLVPVAEQFLDMPARVGLPKGMSGLMDTVSNPAYATSVGLLLWATMRSAEDVRSDQSAFSVTGWLQYLVDRLKPRM